jgi:hypothetical protein
MTITQARLLSIYLSKINPFDVTSREVSIKLEEYAKIMQFKKYNITQLKQSAIELTKLTVSFYKEGIRSEYTKNGILKEFKVTTSLLFKNFNLIKNDRDEWTVNINCHDDVLFLMFELKKHFFKYKLWNTLQLASFNHQRMYELLKQYENAGAREITVKDLRQFLGLKENEYKDWDNFRRRVLESSQKALEENTDIKFTWEISDRQGKGGKINSIRFNIMENENYARQYDYDEFLVGQEEPEITGIEEGFEQKCDEFVDAGEEPGDEPNQVYQDLIIFLMDACENEFSMVEIQVIYDMMLKIVPYSFSAGWGLDAYDYLRRKHNELKWRNENTEINNRFAYFKKLIELDFNVKTKRTRRKSGYDEE